MGTHEPQTGDCFEFVVGKKFPFATMMYIT